MNHLIGDDESLHSSDEDFVPNHVQEAGVHFHLHRRTGQMGLNTIVVDSSDSDSENAANSKALGAIAQQEKTQKRMESYSTTV